ncbi:3412_t:CDS:1, partial [Acaulospora colombiana]
LGIQVVRDIDDDNGETCARPLVAIVMGLGKLVQLRYPPGSGRTNRWIQYSAFLRRDIYTFI